MLRGALQRFGARAALLCGALQVEVDLGPDKPWVLNAKLANPRHWAMVMGTSGQSPNPPTFHCTLAVDGVVQVTDSGPKGALCSLRLW